MLKKLLALLLVLSVAVGVVTGVTAMADNNSDVGWDGTVAEEFAGGDGSSGNPYLISNASQLARCVTFGGANSEGKYFKLADNIVINSDLDNNPVNWYHTKYDAPDDNRTFNGVFDGDGYTISGLYHDGESGPYGAVGLFPAITEKTRIKNIGIINSKLNSGYYAGAIVGSVRADLVGWTANGYSDNYPSIVNSFVGDDVTVKAAFAGGFVGVAVGVNRGIWNTYLSIHNCAFLGKIEGSELIGAEAGDYWNLFLFITNSFSTETLNVNKVGAAKISNVYTIAPTVTTADGTTVQLTDEQAKGEAAKTNMPGLDFDNTWMTNENTYPSLRVFNHPINYTVSFDLSDVEGTEVIADMTSSEGKVILPPAPEGYHWIKGTECVSGEIEVTEDTVIKAAAHSGGTATCKDKAECTVCGEEYGELSTIHGETEITNKKEATCSEKGYTGDEVCKICGYVVKEGKEIDKTAHNYIDGECTECGATKDNSGDPVINDTDNDGESEGTHNSEISNTGESFTVILVALILIIYAVAAVLLFVLNKKSKAKS